MRTFEYAIIDKLGIHARPAGSPKGKTMDEDTAITAME